MRDIRGDLKERASFLEEQISAVQAQFEKRLDQLNQEHRAKIEDLQSALEAVTTLMEREHQRLSNAPVQDERPRQAPAAEVERYPAPEQYRRPEAEFQRRPTVEAVPQRRVVREAEPYRRPAAEVEYQDRPQQEIYRQPARAETEPQPAPPQAYRGAPVGSAREGERPADRNTQAPPPPLADFLLRKLSEMGAMTLDELCHLAVQEGYFTDGDTADRGVHVTLMNVAKAGFVRQQPDGTFAPATVMDTIRLRRAI